MPIMNNRIEIEKINGMIMKSVLNKNNNNCNPLQYIKLYVNDI